MGFAETYILGPILGRDLWCGLVSVEKLLALPFFGHSL